MLPAISDEEEGPREEVDPEGSISDDEGAAAAEAAAAEDRTGAAAAAEAEPENTKSRPDACTEFMHEGEKMRPWSTGQSVDEVGASNIAPWSEDSRAVGVDEVLTVSDRELAQTERLRSIRPQPSAIGLEVAQAVADAVRIGASRVCLDVAECDATLGG